MRLPRIAAIALLGTAAMGVSAANAFADDCHPGHIKAAPHVVWSGHTVRLSTKDCNRWEGPAKATVKLDGVRHTVWLKHHTSAGLTGWLKVPRDTDTGKVNVWGHCQYGPALKGAFWVKESHVKHHWDHHHMCGCRHWDWDRR
jgi:hypothetical protein